MVVYLLRQVCSQLQCIVLYFVVIILIVDAIGDHIVVDDIVLIKPLVYWSCMKCLLFWFGFAMGMM